MRCQRIRGFKLAAVLTIGTYEVGIAEAAYGIGPVLFTASPEIALAEAAKHRCPPGLGTLSLQCIERFLYPIHQVSTSYRKGSETPLAANASRRSTQEPQTPQARSRPL